MSRVSFIASDDVIYQPVQDEIVLLSMKSQQYFGLDDVGSQMWKLLVEHADPEIVADKICEEYDVDRSTARNDLDTFINNLMSAGLVAPVGGG